MAYQISGKTSLDNDDSGNNGFGGGFSLDGSGWTVATGGGSASASRNDPMPKGVFIAAALLVALWLILKRT